MIRECKWSGPSPFSHEFAVDPFVHLSDATANGGVVQHGANPIYLVTSYDLCCEVARDWGRFSSNPDGFEGNLVRFGLAPNPEEVSALKVSGLEPPRSGMSAQLAHQDPPRHTAERRILSRSFIPSVIRRAWQPLIDTTIESFGQPLLDGGSFEFVSGFAAPLPIAVILKILGTPHLDVFRVRHWSDVRAGSSNPSRESWAEKALVDRELDEAFRPELERRMAEPADDLLGQLADAVVNGVEGTKLTLDEAIDVVGLLLVAGNETITQILAGMMYHLISSRSWHLLQEHPELVPSAVEEALRLYTPIVSMFRFCRVDTELGGVPIPAGSLLMLCFGGANHDPAKFQDPMGFDPCRQNAKDHLAFGFGTHHCLGAALARLEASSVYSYLLDNFCQPEFVAGDPPRFDSATFLIRGLDHLPISLGPRT